MYANDPGPRRASSTNDRLRHRRSPLRTCRAVGTALLALGRTLIPLGRDVGSTGHPDLRGTRPIADVGDGSDTPTTVTRGGVDEHPYTVVGLSEYDGGPFLVAAVLRGEVPVVDNSYGSGKFQRHSIFVVATDPDEAEELAARELADEEEPAA
ncbi:hypothetical protein [Amycolatopsis sp. cmx-4-54]|uniref:hypothetical protein n=1 Tax=Amycolatopsis sp. cmx-4-54 TaxID=2790936 RepID=UPI00397BE8BA